MSSDTSCFVWIWLPGQTTPVPAGKLTAEGSHLVFNYGQSYLKRPDAISLFDRELPLTSGILPLPSGLTMPGCIRDAAPDAWGRRVIINRVVGVKTPRLRLAPVDDRLVILWFVIDFHAAFS